MCAQSFKGDSRYRKTTRFTRQSNVGTPSASIANRTQATARDKIKYDMILKMKKIGGDRLAESLENIIQKIEYQEYLNPEFTAYAYLYYSNVKNGSKPKREYLNTIAKTILNDLKRPQSKTKVDDTKMLEDIKKDIIRLCIIFDKLPE